MSESLVAVGWLRGATHVTLLAALAHALPAQQVEMVDTAIHSARADTTAAFRPVTASEYARSLIGPRAIFRALALSGVDQALDLPDAWPQNMQGYGNRLGVRAAGGAIAQTIELGLGATLLVRRAKPSRCDCTGFRSRLAHALLTPLRVESPSGPRLSPLMPLGDIGGALLTTPLMPDGYSTQDGLRRGIAVTLFASVAATAAEFWPWRWRPPGF